MTRYENATRLLNERTAKGAEAISEAMRERDRQDRKWGRSFPGRVHDRWLTILTEEVGEAAEAILDLPAVIYDSYSGDERLDSRQRRLEDLRNEVVQIAAVALSWLENGEWE